MHQVTKYQWLVLGNMLLLLDFFMFHSGWLYTYLSEKYDFVNWNDVIPNIWKNEIHVANHQPVMVNTLWDPHSHIVIEHCHQIFPTGHNIFHTILHTTLIDVLT